MFSGTADKGMAALGAGPLYTNAVMGTAPSAQQREDVRKASSTILRQDSIKVELSDDIHPPFAEQESRPDSLHYARTDQPPYVKSIDGKMMTQTSLLGLPKGNASHDLAFFLKTTGPNAPNRRPKKVDDHPRRAMSASKNVLKWLKVGQRRPFASVEAAHLELNMKLTEDEMRFQDEGGLLLPPTIEQKVSSTGRKYLALKPGEEAKEAKETTKVEPVPETPILNSPKLDPHVSDSHVSISFTDDTCYSSGLDAYYTHWPDSTPPPTRQPSISLGAESEPAIRMICQSSSPVRPAASNPPTPESATLAAESYRYDLAEYPAKRSLDAFGSMSSQRSGTVSPSSSLLPRLALPQEEFPVKYHRAERDFEIKHPSPRRLGSHPVLMHRTPSMAASLSMRSFSDSPGPPPPKSPLRLCRDPRSIEGLISASREARKATPKMAPSIKTVSEYASDVDHPMILPSVTTECTGPITRPRSRERNPNKYPLYPMSRKDREERTRQRKIRDKPDFAINSVVNAPPPPSRRLRKARPQIQIPEFKPAPLATRTSSSASSSASWKKVTEDTLSPVSTVPSQDEKSIGEGKTGYSPKSPTSSNGSPSSGVALSPVMLVAEQVPLPKARSTPKPTRLILRGEGSKYAPRPRSASMSRTALKRRSKGSATTTSRPSTPDTTKARQKKDTTPPLPSPPPNRALPPTPPASGSEVIKKHKPTFKRPSPTDSSTKELPLPPSEPLSPPPLQLRHQHQPSSSFSKGLPHITTQDLRTATSSTSSSNNATRAAARIDARLERLEALEKQNALLNAALMAVLRTNGALNTGPLAQGLGLGEALGSETGGSMGWENRVSRRNTAAGRHAASSSNGSASLDLYLSTRREGS